MKHKYIVWSVISLMIQMVLFGCIRDNGNYEYIPENELLPVTIAPLEEQYQAYQGDSMIIVPKFEKMDDEQRYHYRWYTLNVDREVHELATTRDFKDIVRLPQGEYTLYYEVKDTVRDIFRRVTSRLSVTALIQNGWYILKEIDGMTDFDYEGLDGSRVNDVLQNVVGEEQLKGKPLKLVYQPESYYTELINEEGNTIVLKNQKAIHILSDQELKTLDATTLQIFKQYRDEFYAFPAEAHPMNLNYEKDYLLYIDGGKFYSCSIGGVGKFGEAKYIDNYNYDYELFPEMIVVRDKALIYDRKSRSFLYGTHDAAYLSRFNEVSDETSVTSIKAEMVALFNSRAEYNTMNGYAILKNEDVNVAGDYLLMSLKFSSWSLGSNPVTEVSLIPSDCYLPHASVFGAHATVNCIYFGKGNKLMAYTDAVVEEHERLVTLFDENEEVAFIQNVKAKVLGDTKVMNYLVVATNNVEGWKVYFFALVGETAEIDPNPVHVIKGEGRVKQVVYYNSSKY